MQIVPTLEKVKEIASARQYRVLPVSCEILSDFTTPIETMRILKQVSTHCYMLESAASHETWGRYTFLGFDPSLEITCRSGEMWAGCLHLPTAAPSAYLRQVLEEYKSPRFDHLPPFTGGLVGYFAYDYLGYSESSVRAEVEDREEFRDLDLMLFDKVIAFDHLRQKLILIVNMSLDEPETGYNKAVLELRQFAELLRTGAKKQDHAGRFLSPVTPLFGRESFCRMVERAKVHIREGDIFQIVLSNCLSASFEGSLFNTYRVLRTLNPSPYMFYFPEPMWRWRGRHRRLWSSRKTACSTPSLWRAPGPGEIPRRRTMPWRQSCSPMRRSWLNTICWWIWGGTIWERSAGSVRSMWRSSTPLSASPMSCTSAPPCGASSGRTRTRWMPSRRCCPPGPSPELLSSRACQLIAELENNKRGIYGGAIGYIDFTGNMDTCITIRLAYQKNGRVFVRSGAGIVADSVPEQEFEEYMNKARASLRALELAQEVEL